MKKVFLVDDEIVIRENIRTSINWNEEGFDYCGDAPDGEMALPMIEELRPDILITDIKMPFMNGLELSTVVRKLLPGTKIVILSGHDDFAFAKQAIRIGVEDYCLKPIGSEDLLRVLHLISRKLDKESQGADPFHSMKQNLFQSYVHVNSNVRREDFSGWLDRSRFIECLHEGSPEQSDQIIQQFAEGLKDIDWNATLYGYYLLHELTVEVIREADTLFRNIPSPDEVLASCQKSIQDVNNAEDARQYLRELAELFWKWRALSSHKYGDLIARVKSFVQTHYADENLSLQDAADHVSVSPSHLSKIFSQETGQTFIDYLMQTRIQQAKILMLSSNAKSYEIAYQVGYHDPHYFSSLFKRVTGMNIRDFRKRHKAQQTI